MAGAVCLGVDPGVGGGIAVVGGGIAAAFAADRDAIGAQVRRLCDEFAPAAVVVERVWRGTVLLEAAGRAVGGAEAAGVRVLRAAPAEWRRAVVGDAGADKAAAVAWARRAYPGASLRRTKRARTDDHNLAEALAIAEYGVRFLSHEGRR